MVAFTLNGRRVSVKAEPATPLLWAVREHLRLTGTKYGCGAGLCGACTVHVNGKATRSCVTPVASVRGKKVVTLVGLGTPEKPHPLQTAYIEEQVPQCGYCVNGWIMTAAEMLNKNPKLTDRQIRAGLKGLKCRCGTHLAILKAVKRAAKAMAS